MRILTAVALLFAYPAVAQTASPPKPTHAVTHVSFSTEDGALIYADVYRKGDRGVVLAHGGQFRKRVGSHKRSSWLAQAFTFWRLISADSASHMGLAIKTCSPRPCISMCWPRSVICERTR